MSYEVRNASSKPMIQEAQNMLNNGGGGNLGYFQGGRKKKKQSDSDESIFSENDKTDEFVSSVSSPMNHSKKIETYDEFFQELMKQDDNCFTKIKQLFKKLDLF